MICSSLHFVLTKNLLHVYSCWQLEKKLSGSAFYKVIHTADIHLVDFFNSKGIEGNYVKDSASNKSASKLKAYAKKNPLLIRQSVQDKAKQRQGN